MRGGRRWSLAAAIASVTVFGLSVGQGGPLMPLLLEERGTDTTLNGLNAGAMFMGVLIGPLLAPWFVQRCGIRNFVLACLGLDMALFLALKPLDGLTAWFLLRPLGAVRLRHLHGGRGLDQPARRRCRKGPRARDLCRGAVGRISASVRWSCR